MKTQPKTITVTRAEGFHHECITVTLTGDKLWKQADDLLFAWARTAPKNGGYDKCDFKVVFTDGEEYEGRYDLVHASHGYPSLAGHIKGFLTFVVGLNRPPHLKQADYDHYLAQLSIKAQREPCIAFLTNYEIGTQS